MRFFAGIAAAFEMSVAEVILIEERGRLQLNQDALCEVKFQVCAKETEVE
jgi:hypothetical protein